MTPPKKKKKKRRLKKKYRIIRAVYLTLVIVAALIVIGYGIGKLVVRPPSIDPGNAQTSATTTVDAPGMEAGDHYRREQTYTFMITVPDQASGNGDSIMVVTYDVPNQKLGMLSIPRDTLVNQPNAKINSCLVPGVDNLERVVSDLVGFPIDFYVLLDLDAFVEIVDAVGGVEFDVPMRMDYDDPTQDLHIHFQPGLQHLSGQQALEVCRFRHNSDGTGYPLGDVQRAETAQKMMLTVAKKVMSLNGIVNLGEFVDIVSRNIETDLSVANITWFAAKAMGLNLNTGIGTGTLPGDGTVTYRGYTYCYELYPQESLDLINTLVNPYSTSMTMQDVNIFQAP